MDLLTIILEELKKWKIKEEEILFVGNCKERFSSYEKFKEIAKQTIITSKLDNTSFAFNIYGKDFILYQDYSSYLDEYFWDTISTNIANTINDNMQLVLNDDDDD